MKGLRYFLLVLLLSFVPVCLHSQEASASSLFLSESHHIAPFTTLVPVSGTWYSDRGYLISFQFHGDLHVSPTKPAVVLYDRNGQVAREAIVWFDDAVTLGVIDAAVTPTGKLIVAGGMSNPGGMISHYIAEIDDTGHVGRAIRTPGDFLPVQICTTGDGTVWSFGTDQNYRGGTASMFMLRQFSFEKGQIQGMLDRSALIPSDWMMQNRNTGEERLHCTSQKVGLLNWKTQEWFEFDIPTKTLRTVKINPLPQAEKGGSNKLAGSAMNESGEVFVSMFYRPNLRTPLTIGIYKLKFDNADGGIWVPVTGSFVEPRRHPYGVRLVGADGPDLVYSRLEGTAYWSKVETK